MCQFQILCSLHLELLHRTDIWRSVKAFISTWSCLHLMSEWDTNTLFNVTGLTPNSTRQVSLIFKMVLWVFFFLNLSSKNLTIKPNYVKQYQPSKDYYKIWVTCFRNWLLRQTKRQTFYKISALWDRKNCQKTGTKQQTKYTSLSPFLPPIPWNHRKWERKVQKQGTWIWQF